MYLYVGMSSQRERERERERERKEGKGLYLYTCISIGNRIMVTCFVSGNSKMSIFGGTSGASSFGTTSNFSGLSNNCNPMKDVEVTSPPDDSVSSLAFSPACLNNTFLVAGSWDNNVSAGRRQVLMIAIQ